MANERPCPKCTDHVALTRRTISDGVTSLELDICRACRGVWLDWDELGPAKALSALLMHPVVAAVPLRDERAGVCPACDPSHALRRIPVGAFGIDRCPGCEGLWFDGGELGPMLTDQGFEALLKALRANP
jgi:Zn-finger nucleic acid-binding protein